MEPLMAWLLEQSGLQPTGYRAATMKRRLTSCLRHLRVGSGQAARALLEGRPELHASVLNTVLIGVTEFFRDAAVFEDIASRVLPGLRHERGQVRVCSVGASGGQELYSVAMLLAEAGMLERAWLLGVDCRTEAVDRAAQGVFSETDMAGVSLTRRAAFFRLGKVGWEAKPVIKERIQWRTVDVMGLEIEARQALILFRNVAIYFTKAQAAAAWIRLCGCLAPGGFIVTGKAERPPPGLPLKRIAPSIYQRIFS